MEHIKQKSTTENMQRGILLVLSNTSPIEKNRLWSNIEIANKLNMDRIAILRHLENMVDYGIINCYKYKSRKLYGIDDYIRIKLTRLGNEFITENLKIKKERDYGIN